jgi:hypothetical protein
MVEILRKKIGSQVNSFYSYIPGMFLLFAEAKYLEVVSAFLQTGEFPGEVLYVNSSSPINVGWIFIGQEHNFHKIPPQEFQIGFESDSQRSSQVYLFSGVMIKLLIPGGDGNGQST